MMSDRERDLLERATGELTAELASDAAAQALPPGLAARIIAAGEAAVSGVTPLRPVGERSSVSGWLGWVVAAAAVLAWVLVGSPRGPRPAPAPSTPTVAEVRATLLRDSAATQVLAWKGTEDSLSSLTVGGDVVWNGARQEGVMRIAGLKRNDPSREQYQLWIFDAERDDRYPVDGGVFDVGQDGEVLVPITAKVPVGKAVLFAVTVERPGGVVVSTRERIVLLAQQAS